jgi:hypothetical protein
MQTAGTARSLHEIPSTTVATGADVGSLTAEAVRDDITCEGNAMKKPSMQIGLGLMLGAGLGAAVAVVLGYGGLWLAVGVLVGIAIGSAMTRQKTGGQRINN